jgi:PAP2 superfamily
MSVVPASLLDNIEWLSATNTTERSAAPPAAGGTGPAPDVPDVAAEVERPRWWGELLVVGWLAWLYDTVNNLAPLREKLALAHARGILNFERSLHIAPELTLNRWLVAHKTFGTVLSYYYDNAHFFVTFGLLGWLWFKRADIYRPLRTTLVAINVIGLAVFWLYPVAPPRMLSGFTDIVASSHTFGSWHTGSLAAEANQFAAMPSLHIAWAVWCALVLWAITKRTWVRVLAVIYPCITAFAVLATGNHYVLDLLGGLLTFALALVLARLWASVAHVTRLLLSRKTDTLAAATDDAL